MPSTSSTNTIAVTNSFFSNLSAISHGGAFSLKGSSSVTMSFLNVTLSDSFSGENGGFIYSTGSNPILSISGASSLSQSRAEISGGLAFLSGIGISVISLAESITNNCYALTGSGGLLYLGNTVYFVYNNESFYSETSYGSNTRN